MSEIDAVVERANSAREVFRTWQPHQISSLLIKIAEVLDREAKGLIEVAMRETNLPETRLIGESGRMSGQWRHMAAAVDRGEYLRVVKDPANATTQPPLPDLRKSTVPIGIVGVFGASNFPFAFGVGGCDTAAAIAAGCPVIVKAHPGHPETSRRVFQVICQGIREAQGPEGLINLVEGFDSGVEMVKHDDVSAIAFTGSTSGGRALHDLAQARKNPIPFYGELGGLNPVFVTEECAQKQSEVVAKGFLDSVSLGSGQFCTKPGFLVTIDASAIRREIVALVESIKTHPMLNDSIEKTYQSKLKSYMGLDFIDVVAQSNRAEGNQAEGNQAEGSQAGNGAPSVTVLEVSGSDLLMHTETALQELFGPAAVIVNCKDTQELLDVAKSFHGTLASGIHGETTDGVVKAGLLSLLERISGRVIWNGWPTGVAVTWAMQHGGPYPATTNPLFTSVGADSINRFRRPITYQNFPQALLPTQLQD